MKVDITALKSVIGNDPKAFAKKAQISAHQALMYTTGDVLPSLRTLCKIAKAAGIRNMNKFFCQQ